MSARFANGCEDMFLPGVLLLCRRVWRHLRSKTIRVSGSAVWCPGRAAAPLRCCAAPGFKCEESWARLSSAPRRKCGALRCVRRKRSAPLGPVLLVLRHDGLACCFPVVVGPVAELVEIAAHGERLRAVHG